ncbi:MAG: CoA-binding protein, partial [Pseudomonadota bacterium]|nr:CoA-binding protein [Pseudomonadota bacterium]
MSAALDAAPRTQASPGPLGALLSPRSVAVVGASSDPTRIGGLVVDILRRQGFAGPILPINPSRDEIQGLKAWPSVAAVPGGADLAVIAVPAAAAMAALDDCAAAGVGAAVMLTAGLAETGEPEGIAAQAALVARAKAAGIRLLGPNCAGLANFNLNLAASFHPAFREGGGAGGRIALAAQSGAFGGLAHHEATLRGLTLGAIVTTGNEADVGIADCIEHFAQDSDVGVILAYVESVRDGPRFVAALRAARAARKPVVMVKVGDSEAGMRAAASHTGALAAPSRVMAGLLRQHGVIRARSIEEMFSLGYALDRLPLPRSRRLGIVTGSGGVGVLLADDAAARGLEVAPLGAEAGRRIKEIVPYAGVSNPVDVTGQVLNDPALFERVMETLADEDFGALASHTGISTTLPAFEPRVAALARALRRRRPDLPLAFVGYFTDGLRAALEAAGCACFAEPTHATRALAALCEAAEVFARPEMAPESGPPPPVAVGALPARPREADALRLAAAAGIPVTPFAEVEGPEEAAAAAARFGGPVALKVHAASVGHKS